MGENTPTMILTYTMYARVYDAIHHFWESEKTQRRLALFIFCIFVGSLAAIEANREGLLPLPFSQLVPTNHFQAIHLVFTCILGMEVMGLILSISESLSRSLGKQFEIMALIFLRNAFKELAYLPEPVSLAGGPEPLFRIGLCAIGALGIFVALGFYHRMRRHQNYLTNDKALQRYVAYKKLFALVLVGLFVMVAVRDAWLFLSTGTESRFFETIYTILIFADIALVLISQRFMPSFHAVFRNSGFVIGTLIMRLALSAPSPWDVAAGLFAAVYVLALTCATTYFGAETMRASKGLCPLTPPGGLTPPGPPQRRQRTARSRTPGA